MDRKDIKDLTIEDLKNELDRISVSSYRAKQIFHWVYKKGIHDFSSMTNLPPDFKNRLSKLYYIGSIRLKQSIKSLDKTKKFLFELSDGSNIETVLIHSGKRKTICLSTQVGCKFSCSFCASGFNGFIRNMSTSEIINQILFLQHVLGHRITNFVFMGIGEPLDNYENLVKSIKIMNYPEGLGIGARRITVSTCGIIPGIEKFKDLSLQVKLSISLHATNNKVRDILMPINKIYPLKELIDACQRFTRDTHRKITLEYVLISSKNDSLDDAHGLSKIAKRLKAKVNLIPYSEVNKKGLKTPSRKDVDIFKNRLIANRINVIVRESKGKDIMAACGQLAIR